MSSTFLHGEDTVGLFEAAGPISAGKADPCQPEFTTLVDVRGEMEPISLIRTRAYFAARVLIQVGLGHNAFPKDLVQAYVTLCPIPETEKIELMNEIRWLLQKNTAGMPWETFRRIGALAIEGTGGPNDH